MVHPQPRHGAQGPTPCPLAPSGAAGRARRAPWPPHAPPTMGQCPCPRRRSAIPWSPWRLAQ
eukprot:11188720-Alexandrium_andersonii.AAC.1